MTNIIIDCESVDSAYTSIQQCFGVDRQFLEEFFNSIHRKRYEKVGSNPYIDPRNNLILRKLQKKTRVELAINAVCWFHFTRTFKENEFEDGILPLNQCIGSIWEFLYSSLGHIISRQEWYDFRRNFDASQRGSLKQHHSCQGPFAFLVREDGFKWAYHGNRDYLQAPEIVDDINLVFKKMYGDKIDLVQIFGCGTKPCIVKFIDYDIAEGINQKIVSAALYYLYAVHCGYYYEFEPFGREFNGEGRTIPARQI